MFFKRSKDSNSRWRLNFFNFFSNNIAIDLGTANTIIYSHGKGIVLNEPSIVALAQDKHGIGHKVLAVGQEAKEMLGKAPQQIEVIRPMKDGVIADFNVTEQMIKSFIKKINKSTGFFVSPPTIVICVPCGSTQVERRAIKDSALSAGARSVELIEEAMAAAIGAGVQVQAAKASMVVDIGGGTTEIGIISLGGLTYASSIRIAGDRLDEVILNYVRSKHGLLIGDSTAEKIKFEIGSGHPDTDVGEMMIRGRSAYDGLPRELVITSEEVRLAMREPLEQICNAIRQSLEVTPPEISADLIDNGIILTGGGALLRGIDLLINDKTKLKTVVADEPLLCVAKGCGMSLDYVNNNRIYFNRTKK